MIRGDFPDAVYYDRKGDNTVFPKKKKNIKNGTASADTSAGTFPRACACCGFRTVAEPHDICPVCFWEDDRLQNTDASLSGGANAVCLDEARENFRKFGAVEERFVRFTRPPRDDEK